MRDAITKQRRLSLAGRKPRISPDVMWLHIWAGCYGMLLQLYFITRWAHAVSHSAIKSNMRATGRLLRTRYYELSIVNEYYIWMKHVSYTWSYRTWPDNRALWKHVNAASHLWFMTYLSAYYPRAHSYWTSNMICTCFANMRRVGSMCRYCVTVFTYIHAHIHAYENWSYFKVYSMYSVFMHVGNMLQYSHTFTPIHSNTHTQHTFLHWYHFQAHTGIGAIAVF